MLHFAYTECGLSIDEFYGLSFYEWSLEMIKVKKRYEAEHRRWEWDWARTRSLWLILANANRDSKAHPAPFKPSDLVTLSFDKKEDEEPKLMKPEEVEKKFPKVIIR